MDGFNERQKAFESKFSHDQELEFRVQAKRNRLFGLWAAEQMGLLEDDRENYAQEVIMANFDQPGDEGVINKVALDLIKKEVEMTDRRLKKELERLQIEAHKMVMTDDQSHQEETAE